MGEDEKHCRQREPRTGEYKNIPGREKSNGKWFERRVSLVPLRKRRATADAHGHKGKNWRR